MLQVILWIVAGILILVSLVTSTVTNHPQAAMICLATGLLAAAVAGYLWEREMAEQGISV